MKYLLNLLLLLLWPLSVYSQSEIDGAYSCSISGVIPNQAHQKYITITSKPNGAAIFTVVSESQSHPIYGYGVGTFYKEKFQGRSSAGGPFSLDVKNGSMEGTVSFFGPRIGFPTGDAQVFSASVNCSKVW